MRGGDKSSLHVAEKRKEKVQFCARYFRNAFLVREKKHELK
jgi:hypothetical protein